MKASEAVRREELPSARTRQSQDVLQIGRGGRDGADDRRIHWAARGGDERKQRKSGTDLEAPRRDVLMRDRVAHEVEKQTGSHGAPT